LFPPQVATEIEAARLHVYNAARLLDHGMEHEKAARLAWNYGTRIARKSSSMSIEWLGGVGFTKDFPAEKFFRDSKQASRFPAISQGF
jgi:alkylation response protein AidB-like acyl-CoA dehydrogenase